MRILRGPQEVHSFEEPAQFIGRDHRDVFPSATADDDVFPVLTDFIEQRLAERFMKAYLGAIADGDAERLARVLNPDDVDFPVPRAREMIASYRKRYRDVASIRAEFVGVDERKDVLRWRLRGPGPNGKEVTEPIDLGFGDGLIGIRGL